MLERALSSRRAPPFSDDGDDDGDQSKTRKHISVPTKITNYLIRTGHLWPCLLIGLVIIVLTSFVYHTRDLVCISASSSDHISRLRFFGFDGLETDFGSLGVPWCRSKHGKTVEWTTKDLIKGLEEFVPIYETRPIKNNMYGMGFDHSFGLWFMTRWLKPELMIESGAFKGHSTWVLRQAMPDTPIISLTPRHPEKYLKKGPAYVDGNCTYFAGKDFVDFGSVDWRKVMKKHGVKDLSQVLVFFDDHQNELKRLKQALKAGFRHLVFEDNYDTGTGDHYSFRQMCDQFYIRADRSPPPPLSLRRKDEELEAVKRVAAECERRGEAKAAEAAAAWSGKVTALEEFLLRFLLNVGVGGPSRIWIDDFSRDRLDDLSHKVNFDCRRVVNSPQSNLGRPLAAMALGII
ncbi:PREDICTED: uncharacterized protein LOC109205496 [Nicotiana attenuata]|uniref:uncharacterized protein LOC109205496 n=1 Tax=Nicotiana attenuata TaxID=49451 RepID=UPI0009052794|nr:PREDICTED: uncharacterized protein LOC109205496 [Nicotiana attenuata]